METAQDGLPWKLARPHKEINEDGKELDHPGYAMFPCAVCKNLFIVARPQAFTFKTCGRVKCNL